MKDRETQVFELIQLVGKGCWGNSVEPKGNWIVIAEAILDAGFQFVDSNQVVVPAKIDLNFDAAIDGAHVLRDTCDDFLKARAALNGSNKLKDQVKQPNQCQRAADVYNAMVLTFKGES